MMVMRETCLLIRPQDLEAVWNSALPEPKNYEFEVQWKVKHKAQISYIKV